MCAWYHTHCGMPQVQCLTTIESNFQLFQILPWILCFLNLMLAYSATWHIKVTLCGVLWLCCWKQFAVIVWVILEKNVMTDQHKVVLSGRLYLQMTHSFISSGIQTTQNNKLKLIKEKLFPLKCTSVKKWRPLYEIWSWTFSISSVWGHWAAQHPGRKKKCFTAILCSVFISDQNICQNWGGRRRWGPKCRTDDLKNKMQE